MHNSPGFNKKLQNSPGFTKSCRTARDYKKCRTARDLNKSCRTARDLPKVAEQPGMTKSAEQPSRAENLASAWAQHQSRSRYGRRACVLWRETSPQDFQTTTGAYAANGAGWLRTWYNKAACASHANQTDSPWEPVHAVLTRGGIPLVRVWRASRLYFDHHLDRNTLYMRRKGASDCTHYCTPGPIDTWIDPLLRVVVDSCSRRRGYVVQTGTSR
jgi:hypothetical protein